MKARPRERPHTAASAAGCIVLEADEGRAVSGGKGLRTELVLILDASGSMHHLTADATDGLKTPPNGQA